MLRGELGQRAVLELGEFLDTGVTFLDAFAEFRVFVIEPGDLAFAWVRNGLSRAQVVQPPLELLGQVLIWPRALVSLPVGSWVEARPGHRPPGRAS